jgi:hypothetical protein
MSKGIHIVMWLFLGSLVVLIVTHAGGFATAVTAVGGQLNTSAALLAGYGPGKAARTQPAHRG